MRTLLAVLGLVPVVLILEGCGGSGACKNKQIEMVTQSTVSSGEFNFKVNAQSLEIKIPPVPVNLIEKIDMDNMKVYVQGDVTVEPIPGIIKKKSDLDFRCMIDVGAKTMAYAVTTVEGLKQCQIMDLPANTPAPGVVSKCIKDAFAKEGLAPAKGQAEANGVKVDGPSCSRSGGLDSWTTKVNVDMSKAGMKSGKLELTEEYKVDDDFLFQEMTLKGSGEGKQGGPQGDQEGSGKFSGTIKASSAEKTGPTAQDLDTTTWKGFTCRKQIPPPCMQFCYENPGAVCEYNKFECPKVPTQALFQSRPGMAEAPVEALTQAFFQRLIQSRPGGAAILQMMNEQNHSRRLQGGSPSEMPAIAKCFQQPQANAVVSV